MKNEFIIDATGSKEEAIKQVELKSKALEGVQENTHVEQDDAQSSNDDTPLEEQYNIALGIQEDRSSHLSNMVMQIWSLIL